ncbi:manganese transport system membrane protein MntC [Verrucomicrobiota bacterium]|jgi:ABC-type Mn2+/Zn2+ transport system permease subunit|nr:manganese transport system membrane protein MntC [Verrucomicrobiota bacterium]
MNFLHDLWSHEFMRRALVGGALIGFTNGFLGTFIVLRRMSLMADALSHSMLPGLALGLLVAGGLSASGLFLGGITAAFLVALGAMLLARTSRLKEDASLAILYTVAFSAGVVLLQFVPTPVDLKHWLFGDILGIGDADLWIAYGVTLAVVPGLLLVLRPLVLTLFDPMVARSQGVKVDALHVLLIAASVLAMISSAQAVGVILMLGLLVAPAATLYLLTDNFSTMLWGGAALGTAGSVLGLVLSYRFEKVPSGAAIVLVLGVCFLAAWAFGPRYGLLARLRKRRHFHEESLSRWEHGREHKH